jgi:acetyl-CoA synthetase
MSASKIQAKKTKKELTEVLMQENKFYPPSQRTKKNATVKNWQHVQKVAAQNPLKFWGQAAAELTWYKSWRKVLDATKKPFYKWFVGAECNIVANALNRHIDNGAGENIAIIAESELGKVRKITYNQLNQQVNKLAYHLQQAGMKKGDTLAIYMPNISEAAVTMLACAKIGVIHSVVYAGFSAAALTKRIKDSRAKIVMTVDGSHRRGKIIRLKDVVDEAIKKCKSVKKVIVVRNARNKVRWSRLNVWYDDFVKGAFKDVPNERMSSEDPLFILYTSGTTGTPKGVVHVHGGYMVGVHRSIKWIFDLKPGDIYWCTADPGWITGHSYIVYGPLMAGVTTLMYEGAPDYPKPDRVWRMIAKFKVTVFYTAPTFVRAMMKYGNQWPKKHNLQSLRLLGSVGEPINPEAWRWYYNIIGGKRCSIMDTWWQTETGMCMITPLPTVPLKAGSATFAFPGIKAAVVDKKGRKVPTGKGGLLVIKNPWPAMLRTVYRDPKRYLDTYWRKVPGVYTTGDLAHQDKDGYFWIQGRVDDVLKISGHRLGTAEIESALVSHPAVVEAGVIGLPHPVKGEVAKAFVILKQSATPSDDLTLEIRKQVRKTIGPIAVIENIEYVKKLPKTRSGKIMRRILKAEELGEKIGDTSTLAD